MPNETDKSCSTKEAAHLLKVSVQTVQKWADAGHLSGWKTMGGHRRISYASIERLLSGRQFEIAPESPLAMISEPAPAETPAPVPPEPVPPPRQPLILVVDDSPDDRELISEALHRQLPDFERIECADAISALLQIGQRRPDVVITDLMMPGIDGVAMIRQICAFTERPKCIVAVTSWKRDELRRLGTLPPEVPLLHKPVDARQLAELIRTALAAAPALQAG